jgi:SAM-dependent methyltransferase
MQAPHYDADYFRWQQTIGEFGGWANSPKFAPYIRPTDSVLDFGCGGGYLLANLHCAKRVGVEVNSSARQVAANQGIEVYKKSDGIPDGYVDKLISNHALEHVHHPLAELKVLREKLRPGGLAILVVPSESIDSSYEPGDINQHLYTWNPMTFGNLVKQAGFKIIHSRALYERWPPMYRLVAKVGGRRVFDLATGIYGRIARSLAQVHLLAQRP